MSAKVKPATVRDVLREKTTGKGDEEIAIYRRPLRILFELAEAIEEYRAATREQAALFFKRAVLEKDEWPAHLEAEAENGKRVRIAQGTLDDLIGCLNVIA